MTEQITWRLEHENVGRLLLHYAIPAVIGRCLTLSPMVMPDFSKTG